MKISIIIPCYNSEKWIEECIMSALNQDYENLEVWEKFLDFANKNGASEPNKRYQG